MPKAGSATMYTSGCPKNQNRCWNRMGLPPVCSDTSPMDSSAGMKKLVPSTESSNSIMQATSNAGKASRPRMVATKMPHTESGMRIMVIPRQRACSTVVT